MTLKLKKTLLKRKVNGEVVPGYYGRVLTNGTAEFSDICQLAGKGMTLDPIEIEACAKAFCRDAADQLKQGMIVDLGPLGKLYPSVNGPWNTDKDELSIRDCDPKVNYRPSDDVAAAVRAAKLAWATEAESTKPTTDEDAGDDTPQPSNGGQGGDSSDSSDSSDNGNVNQGGENGDGWE